jgi:hypothetical protein
MRLLITSTLLTICFAARGQNFLTKKGLTFYPGTYIDTESWYSDSTGIEVIIQNSIPRWGTPLLDSMRRESGYSALVFFNRIINETNTPLELTINFPADSFPMLQSSDSYLKLFLPPDTMTLANEGAYSYGLTGLESFLNTNFNKASILQRTINPKGAYLFYVVSVCYHSSAEGNHGEPQSGTRAAFVLKGQNLFYRISEHDLTLIPCGKISRKN